MVALQALGHWHAVRQYLREWLYDGADRAAPCQTQIEATTCFAPLLRWLLAWWQGGEWALAIDATAHQDRVVALVVSVLYRSSAIPVAWHILPANQPGAWLPPLQQLLRLLAPVVPPTLTVLVLADRGLWRPRLWRSIRAQGWQPLLRLQTRATFRPYGQRRVPAPQLVPGPGHAWVGRGVAFKHQHVRRRGTRLVVWDEDQAGPWVLLTDLAPDAVGVCWYGLRVWIALGFRALKGVGWSAGGGWTLAYGTRAEDADQRGRPPARLRSPPAPAPRTRPRLVSVFRLGLSWLRIQLLRRWLWRRLWLTPEPWPQAPPHLQVIYHGGA